MTVTVMDFLVLSLNDFGDGISYLSCCLGQSFEVQLKSASFSLQDFFRSEGKKAVTRLLSGQPGLSVQSHQASRVEEYLNMLILRVVTRY